MVSEVRFNPDSIRSVNPQAYPQFPFNDDELPVPKERSEPIYAIKGETDLRVQMRDGVKLALDVFRPASRPGETFPALVGFGPYTRQLQQTNVPIGQNEGGIKEFWVPRGYAMVFVDVRGSNDSEGGWQMYGTEERRDFAEVIEWVAEQPWCTGAVGMTGASYYGRAQLMAAQEKPPSLKAIFAYDAATDAYRDTFFHGGIPNEGMQRNWFAAVEMLNTWDARLQNKAELYNRIHEVVGGLYPYDGEYYQSRSSSPRLHEIEIPVYFGCHWSFIALHLRGAFEGWLRTGEIPKRMLISPTPIPRRPVAELHQEMLRWYDLWLKEFDTGVMDGPPIQLWIPGEDRWRGEDDWPLPRTDWRQLYLQSDAHGDGSLEWSADRERERTYEYRPGTSDWLWGEPKLRYRTAPLEEPMEITGPMQLDLWFSSTAEDTDALVTLYVEHGEERSLLSRGWLRASHRATDPTRAFQNRPWHPHTEESVEPLPKGEAHKLEIEVIPNSYAIAAGSRLCLEIASSDNMPGNLAWYHRSLMTVADNTVYEGGDRASTLHIPVIPQR